MRNVVGLIKRYITKIRYKGQINEMTKTQGAPVYSGRWQENYVIKII